MRLSVIIFDLSSIPNSLFIICAKAYLFSFFVSRKKYANAEQIKIALIKPKTKNGMSDLSLVNVWIKISLKEKFSTLSK